MVIGIEHIGQVIYKTGLVILCHRAAAPVNIHIRRLFRTHRNYQLLLVVIVLLMNFVYRNVWIICHKSCYCILTNCLARIFCRNIP